ncbi:RsmB/NOP family class I SAM-dependent RNA methyltransferase [Staphylothermus hellenicus]|uniref:Fmu (Sun) domain protein n=1 Tax=Staphylothermus hellenicus (strain DSM 12710 / JCM 10830 / BK20S6-10-b1 / P8) TaxID=591019 RepID=D7DBK9_STAHD|nr:RsmB/NOP family class I SAM-dependent RNA methyltransferase [Staphylothermus hellenicus]ADI31556.1 Fmu (Sun) domain protein [Staphylothermus hellenicus DSM 12710]
MARLDLEKEMVLALVEAVRLSERIKPSQDAKRRAFRKYGILGSKRDPLVTAVFYGVMKRLGILDLYIRSIVGVNPYIIDPWLRAALRVLLEIKVYRDPSRRTLRYLRGSVAKLLSSKTHPFVGMYYARIYDKIINENYVFKPRNEDEELLVKYMLPPWYVRKIIGLLGNVEAEKLFKALDKQLPLSVRVNTLKTGVEEVLEILRREVKWVRRSSIVSTIIKFPGPYNFDKSDLFRKGYIVIQEEAAAVASLILDPKPGMTVVDMAAAPGGKTQHIAELMGNEGVIYAFDVDKKRIDRMQGILRRTGVRIAKIYREDSRKAPEILGEKIADRVLLDAPCSSDGTIMKNPDLRWRLREEKIAELQKLQYEMLEAGWKLLKPGGKLLYCTCSMLLEENEHIIEKFLRKHRDAEIIPLNKPYDPGFLPGTMRAWPHRHETIGFFYALLKKKSG